MTERRSHAPADAPHEPQPIKPVFVHISKNAGTSIVATAGGSITDAGHRTAASWVAQHGSARPLFAVVRHPYDRVLSEYYYRRGRWRSGEVNPHLENLDLAFDDWVADTFSEGTYRTRSFFERSGVPFPEHDMVGDQLIWFIPQVEWLSDEREVLLTDDLLRYEHLAQDWATFATKYGIDRPLEHANRSSRSARSEQLMGQRSRTLIHEHYRVDFERFGYEPGVSTGREWASISFRPSTGVKIPEAVRQRCRWVDYHQAEDHTRFVAGIPALLQRLDLSRGVLTAMTCDDRFSILFANWAASCDRYGIDVRATTLVFPTDEQARDRIESLGFVAYFDDESQLLREMQPSGQYGDRLWLEYMYHQNWVIAQMLTLGVNLLFQDVDVVWRHDPVPTLQAQAAQGADVQAMYDGPNARFQPLYANSGFMYFHNTPEVRDFWAEVCAHNELVGYYRSQQEPLNVILAAHAHRGLDVRVLDEDRFTNGHRYTAGRTPPDDPWVIHVSWTQDLATKLERYEANNLWFLDDPPPLEPAPGVPAVSLPAAPGAAPPTNGDGGGLLRLLADISRERDALASRLAAMQRSTSWRATAPLRRISDAWHRRP